MGRGLYKISSRPRHAISRGMVHFHNLVIPDSSPLIPHSSADGTAEPEVSAADSMAESEVTAAPAAPPAAPPPPTPSDRQPTGGMSSMRALQMIKDMVDEVYRQGETLTDEEQQASENLMLEMSRVFPAEDLRRVFEADNRGAPQVDESFGNASLSPPPVASNATCIAALEEEMEADEIAHLQERVRILEAPGAPA
jgi:hypothetical protein